MWCDSRDAGGDGEDDRGDVHGLMVMVEVLTVALVVLMFTWVVVILAGW